MAAGRMTTTHKQAPTLPKQPSGMYRHAYHDLIIYVSCCTTAVLQNCLHESFIVSPATSIASRQCQQDLHSVELCCRHTTITPYGTPLPLIWQMTGMGRRCNPLACHATCQAIHILQHVRQPQTRDNCFCHAAFEDSDPGVAVDLAAAGWLRRGRVKASHHHRRTRSSLVTGTEALLNSGDASYLLHIHAHAVRCVLPEGVRARGQGLGLGVVDAGCPHITSNNGLEPDDGTATAKNKHAAQQS